jgi:hypothetical protein
MPDTDCAKPQWGSAFQPDCCAMISGSGDHCGKLHLLSRLAGRSTQMTGSDRSKLSCRTLLFLFVLLGMPMAARCATLEDSAKELAGKIAAVLPPREGVTVDIQNISTLTPGEVARVSKAFTGVLQDSGFITALNTGEVIHVKVTLSENVKGFIWSAEISPGDSSRVVFMAVLRILEDEPASKSIPILLSSEKFWEGPEQILDAVELTTPNDTGTLFLLQPDGLTILKKTDNSEFKIEIPSAHVATRSPFGLILSENTCQPLEFSPCVVVMLNGYICTIALEKHSVGECHIPGPADARDPMPPLVFKDAIYPWGRSEPRTLLSSHCGAEIGFGTGSGDYTQPDFVEAFEWRGETYVPLSNELGFPGPVLALQVTDHVPTAIVQNLGTGSYEAYRLAISCTQ